ncbi:HGxxPAAW family protein [Nostocoides jenkinsii]|uniref:Uncharacterized protein n=1 Tax=Nostocoides jenkinsii Ben 74 TaxID=1193518 RepID=A0A077MCW4_9MICO|nr:HGxxPAAW family protein [Tetrasphaera jenkinsii]CCI52623.1 conserved hypothetical protein [Tetrasphaera jenkinsii Ben 74]
MHAENHEGHGNSVAAWVSVVVMLVGFLTGALGVLKASVAVTVVGAVIVLIGAVLWPLLAKMGYGDKNPPRPIVYTN